MEGLTAARFLDRLQAMQDDEELRKIQRYFKFGAGEYGEGDRFIGVRMGQVFALAREFIEMPPDEIERLMESPIHEARAGAMRLMADQYRLKRTSPERRQDLYSLYLRRHDRINNWDLVDLAAWWVVGSHLVERPRGVLYELAESPSMWERRTAILATFPFIRRGQFADTFALSEQLMADEEDLIHKACGGMLRAVSDQDPRAFHAFMDRHAARMPRTMLRYAIEKLPAAERRRYMEVGR
ncbi:MAG: DNA alkylation repair protein [Hyphomicrobiales bacterium]|nr:MAG: DNA alkylation repair protein [Hyphomicrobiales bacterium]